MPEALDPVGKEDADIDNDGDTDSSDKYLHKRRKAIGKAIAADRGKKKSMKEEMEESLREKMQEATALHQSKDATTSSEKQIEITEKPVNNKITVNPEMKESVSNMILRMYEDKYIGEGMKQARKNVGASTCWDGYTAKGTKKKNGKEVPNCVKEEELVEGEKAGLGGNRGPTQGGSSARDRGGETTTIQKKQEAQRDAENARGDRGREFTKPAQLNQLKRTQPTNMRNSYEPEGRIVEGHTEKK